MQVELKVRRLRCANPGCAARTFSEACADFPRHAQRSARLQERQVALGFSVGAEAGSVLLDRFHMSASPDTLLRTMKRQPLPQHPTPRVLGVDDWAIRKGVRYGTILVDLERHQVVDVIKERSADALRDWLSVYPGIEIITRDRASDYSRAGTRAAPRALQLADRWHLLCNLSGVVQEWLLRERQHWMTVVAQVKAQLHLPNPEASPSSPPATMPISQKKRREQYREVLLLDQQGLPSRQVARVPQVHQSQQQPVGHIKLELSSCPNATLTSLPQQGRAVSTFPEGFEFGCERVELLRGQAAERFKRPRPLGEPVHPQHFLTVPDLPSTAQRVFKPLPGESRFTSPLSPHPCVRGWGGRQGSRRNRRRKR
ncbi:hypothetical protein DAETH_39650 (plasmid) [Deinococcus aetherius]|uniref:Transposase IS204/IS1001/IS1096/IS1165 DDE domain-containing protein n=1 Tax=Deinococcus aetherius TaxID=200252 RepID=A0ABN6RL35_9DEIO|nr:hypothetical protein DAETH_39650 [Deinococcus aetherius]